MAITTKNRTDLKSNFVKNAIPTEQNFADLVDGQLNQADDGVFKLAGEPFSVVAAGGDQKRALRLYGNYPAANPDWLISLNPAQEPGNAATNRPGFGITDGAGNTRLFLDPTGKLGLGTNEPQGAIDVRIGGSTNPWSRFVVANTPAWGDAGVQHVTIGAGGGAGIMFSNPHVVWNDSRASIRYGRTGGTAGDTYWDVGGRADGRFSFIAADNGAAGEQVTISKTGVLTAKAGLVVEGGVAHIDRDGALYRNVDGQVYLTVDDNLFLRDSGAATWAAQFETNSGSLNLKGALTAASASISGFTSTQGIAVNNGQNTGVGRGLWLWGPSDSAHVIYSANSTGKSPANLTPVNGFFNNNHRMRLRTASGQGFLFENSGEVALVDIASDTGNLWTRGAIYAGSSDLYFTKTDHKHSGIGNTAGFAAIENASDYAALMILGRQVGDKRIVKLWDYLEVNGDLRVTGSSLQIGDWTLQSAGNHLYIKRGTATVARFSIANDRFNVFRDVNGVGPYFYYNQQGGYNSGGSGAPP